MLESRRLRTPSPRPLMTNGFTHSQQMQGAIAAPCRLRPTALADQNSAGRYPLISRPMQISTSVGVVQAMEFPLVLRLTEKYKRCKSQCNGIVATFVRPTEMLN